MRLATVTRPRSAAARARPGRLRRRRAGDGRSRLVDLAACSAPARSAGSRPARGGTAGRQVDDGVRASGARATADPVPGRQLRRARAEGGRPPTTWPEVFVRGADSVAPPYGELVKPALSARFDYEGELGVVIGRGGRYIPRRRRDRGDRRLRGVHGRHGARVAARGQPVDGREELRRDDADRPRAGHPRRGRRVRRSAHHRAQRRGDAVGATSQMIFDVPRTIEFLSSFTTLRPGDVIATGTPGGVGFARQPPVWLQPGDTLEITVEGVGASPIGSSLRNSTAARNGRGTHPSRQERRSSRGAGASREEDKRCWCANTDAGVEARACSLAALGRRAAARARVQRRRRPSAAAPAARRSRGHADGRRRGSVHRARRGARPHLPRLVRRRDERDQQRGRRARSQVHVQGVDTRGDPADAVPAVRQMYASSRARR